MSIQATYAVAAEALADAAEWEWCLVLLEELEQQQILDGDKKDKVHKLDKNWIRIG